MACNYTREPVYIASLAHLERLYEETAGLQNMTVILTQNVVHSFMSSHSFMYNDIQKDLTHFPSLSHTRLKQQHDYIYHKITQPLNCDLHERSATEIMC